MVTPMSTVHDIRLANHGGLHHGTCSCGWTSPEVAAVSTAARAAVFHSNNCGGVAAIGTTATTAMTSRLPPRRPAAAMETRSGGLALG